MILCVIKDNKGDFGPVYTFENSDIAKRNVSLIIPGNPLMKEYPEDFALYSLASYDSRSGSIVPEASPVFICNVSDLIRGE